MSWRVFVNRLGIVHLGLSILLIVHGIKLFSNPDTIIDIFPECGVEKVYNYTGGGFIISHLDENEKRMITILGVCVFLLGIILGLMDLYLCFRDFKDEVNVEFLKRWLTINTIVIVLYTLSSIFLMYFNLKKLWIHITEIIPYSLNSVIIFLVAGFTYHEVMRKKEKGNLKDSDGTLEGTSSL